MTCARMVGSRPYSGPTVMDVRLMAWAQAAAARPGAFPRLPKLWLFTDARRLPDPRHAAARLPRGLAGVVLRHDGEPGREALGRDLARICRVRRLALVVAGDVRLAAALRPAFIFVPGAGRPAAAWSWSDHQFSPRAGGPATRQASGSRAHFPRPGLCHRQPSRSRSSRPRPLGAHGQIRANAGRGARRHHGTSVRRLPVAVCAAIGAIGALT